MESVFSTRICDSRIFERQWNGPPIAFEERKTDERIESNSTFRFPSEVSPLTGAVGARLMQQCQEVNGKRLLVENSILPGACTANHVSKKIT
jgi:hypothetical protein